MATALVARKKYVSSMVTLRVSGGNPFGVSVGENVYMHHKINSLNFGNVAHDSS